MLVIIAVEDDRAADPLAIGPVCGFAEDAAGGVGRAG